MSRKSLKWLLVIGAPLLFALAAWYIFDEGSGGWVSLMALSFIVGMPYAVGALLVALLPEEKLVSRRYAVCYPWIPLGVFLFITLLAEWEGWACWIMVMPLFMIAASLGGLAARYIRRHNKSGKTYISLILLLPFLTGPLEQQLDKLPARYEAYTYIDIHAPKEKIWSNVTRVREIREEQDKGWFTRALGFPRPLYAELNFEGKGGFRKAVFDRGLVFDETVLEYEHQKKMRFSIKANPHEIPAATLDEHIVVGGEFFDVLDGTYELEQLPGGGYRLHLYSHFKLSTTFNFYASWWAGWIMKDIQHNILQVIRHRAEQEG
ncbi:SRPBCC family protein [Chitinophaga lutea]